MIEFSCKNCGQKIQISDSASGKNGKCPKCRIILTVPAPQKDLSIKFETPEPKKEKQDYFQYQNSIINANKADEEEIQSERELPWIIDIFLYPFSKPGLTMLGILIGVPLFLNFIGEFLRIGVLSIPALAVLLILASMIGFLIRIVMFFYTYWYICECVRDSSEGWIRASETAAKTPDIFELLGQFLKILICLIIFVGPSATYWFNTRSFDTTFWIIVSISAFFFPMALLAVIIFDSLRGLNPLLIIPSIFSTFFPYCGLIIFIGVIVGLFILLIQAVSAIPFLSSTIGLLSIYTFMVKAHLLGRFYFKYQEKLYWDV